VATSTQVRRGCGSHYKRIAGNGDPLLLAAGQLGGKVPQLLAEADVAECLGRAGAALSGN
jgi:hypothetical protein